MQFLSTGHVISVKDLQRALEEKCFVMYYRHNSGRHEYFQLPEHTHKAFVFGNSELPKEPCKHEPIDNWWYAKIDMKCKHCGEKLKPVAWEVEG